MQSEPQKEHEWFKQLVGEWTSEAEFTMEPGKPPSKSKGTESVRMLGGLWMVAEGKGEMPGGGEINMVMTLGYDPRKKRYVGTWVGSVMDLMFVYDGKMDKSGKVLTLETEAPDFSGKMTKCQDIIEIVSKDHRTLNSRMLGANGKWNHFMTVHYRRKKKPSKK